METREFEKVFYLFISKNPKYFGSVSPEFFDSEPLQAIYDATRRFYEKFRRSPDRDQVKKIVSLPIYRSRVDDSHVDIVFDEPYDTLDPEWVSRTCEAWVSWKNLTGSLVDAVSMVRGSKVDSDNVTDMVNKVKTLINDRNNVNFSKDLGKDFFKAADHYSPSDLKISSNHVFVDRCMGGGYRRKSLVVYAGESNVGKSIWLANDAVNFVKSGKNVAVISAEMGDTDFIQRIGANLLDIDIAEYESVAADERRMAERLQALEDSVVPPGRLFVKEYPTSAVTTIDIEAYLKELQAVKGVKLDVVIIDYINVLNNHRNPNSENTYMKVKQLAEDLRAMAVRNEWVVITATQLNRNGYESTEITISHIAESAGLTHTADTIYGIIQDMQMKASREYWLKIMKVRNGAGKNTKCRYTIDYSRMRLHETEDLQEE